MSDIARRISGLSPEQRALLEKQLKSGGSSPVRREPIAIVGMGCRFPGGADGPDAFWQLLREGRDAIREVPRERWDVDALYDPDPAAAGKVASRWGGFLDGVDGFDAAFFGISPREAVHMDPQQRLWLEVAWEALEDAGQDLARLAGSATGVFVGVHSHASDYLWLQYLDPEGMDPFTGPGTAHNLLAGRLSYQLDLQGPGLVVDTACSSSLLAVHLACQSLRAGESDMAVAGGVNLMLTPHFSIAASRMRMLAPDGRCKAFDRRADGFVRGEGCGAVVLKRLADARAAGDPVRAVILGSAANQDGRTNGVTAPNGLAQQSVIRLALKDAGVTGEAIGYVEAHGTGTALGDPVEIEALAASIGRPRPDGTPCLVGSVKTNIGHLEGAAGIAGLIKAALVLEQGAVPPNLHFTGLNPHITVSGTPLQFPDTLRPWPRGGTTRVAAVSSFGWSGTNVHVVLQEADPPAALAEGTDDRPGLLPLSARSDGALRDLARAFRERLATAGSASPGALHDLCYSASVRRAHHDHRLAVVGSSAREMARQLDAFLQGAPAERSWSAGRRDPDGPPGLVFVFPGQGSQWLGMGRELSAHEAAFREALQRCDAAVREHSSWSVMEELAAPEERSRLTEIDVVQPLLFSIQVALAALWRAWGIEPAAVVGHSMGEVAAAHVAGALDLADAARVICRRSRLLKRVSGQGAMAVVGLPFEKAREAVAPVADRLSVAVSNGPTSTVLSGDPAALERVLQELRERNVFCRAVQVDVASHSPQVDSLRDNLLSALAGIAPHPPTVPFYSTVTAERVLDAAFTPEYWSRNLREPVLFHATVRRLVEGGHGTFLELSPHPILLAPIEEALHAAGRGGPALPSLHREGGERQALRSSLGALYTSGREVDWRRLYPAGGRAVRVPRYPWQRKRYWVESRSDGGARAWPGALPPRRPEGSDPARARRYRLEWRQRDASAPTADRRGWLILADRSGVGRGLAGLLEERGEQVRLVATDQPVAGDVEALVRSAAASSNGARTTVVNLWSLDAETGEESAESIGAAIALGCISTLRLLRALGSSDANPTQLWLVTRGTQPVGPDPRVALGPSPLWGLGRVVALEQPESWGGLVDLDPAASPDDSRALLAQLLNSDGEDQVAIRGGRRFVPRLVAVPEDHAPDPGAPSFRSDAAYLVSGGLGGLGLHVARWLVQHGAGEVVLVGRTGLPERAEWDGADAGSPAGRRIAAVRELEARGARVTVAAADVSDREAMEELFGTFGRSRPPLRGVVHAAGILFADPVVAIEPERFHRMLRAKVAGGWILHELTRREPLDFFVLFSSGASVWGSKDLGHYAAANHFLDALAHSRRAAGLPALAVNWGWCAGGGMETPEIEAFFRRIGLTAMSPEQSLSALGHMLGEGSVQEAVAAVDWEVFKPIYEVKRRRPLLEEIGTQPSGRAVQAAESLLDRLQALPPEERRVQLRSQVAREVARILGFDSEDAVEPRQGFFKLGMDSILSVQLRNRLEAALGRSLPPTVAFEYPTVEALGDYLLQLTLPTPESRSMPATSPPAAVPPLREDLSEDQLEELLARKLQGRP